MSASAITDESAVITLEVKLISSVKGLEGEAGEPIPTDIVETSPEMREIIREETNDALREAMDDALREAGFDAEAIDGLTEMVSQVDSKGIGNLTKFAKQPTNFIENQFMTILSRAGPYGALIAAIIAAIVAAPEVVKAIVEAFAVKGGPLNQDYRYTQEEFQSQEYDRITQFKRLTGDDPVITVNTQGFVVGDPDFKGNSLIDANPARTGRVGLRDSSYGYIHGI